MKATPSPLTASRPQANATRGWINGLIGVLIFSGSLPATRVAVQELDPTFLTVARASIAGLLALCLLLASGERRPTRQQLLPLVVVALGVVLGFPLLTALALQYVTSAHSIVFLGLLPWPPPCSAWCAEANDPCRLLGILCTGQLAGGGFRAVTGADRLPGATCSCCWPSSSAGSVMQKARDCRARSEAGR